MTRQEAIEWLTDIKCVTENWAQEQAVEMAIEALSAEYDDYEHATLVDIKEPLKALVVRCNVDHDRDWIIGCIEHDGFIHTHRFDKANQIILEALSAEAVQGWIPCSERLPKENENVLADDGIDMFVAWYNNGWNSTDHACDPYTYIIAWMPLPKPYKGGEDE